MQVGVAADGVVVAMWQDGKMTEAAMPAEAAFDQALSMIGAACDVDPNQAARIDRLPAAALVRERRREARAVRR